MPKKPDRGDTSQPKPRKSFFDQISEVREESPPSSKRKPDTTGKSQMSDLARHVLARHEHVTAVRAANPPRRIASDTIDVLTRLDAAIAAATKHLKKMPGARKEGVEVDVANVLFHDEFPCFSDEYVLTLHNDAIQVRNEFMSHPEATTEVTHKPLDKYDTDTRIQLCKYIPDLITAAKAAEEKVREEAEDAIASIEQAIAMSLEVGDE